MGYTPNPFEIIQADIDELKADVAKLKAAQGGTPVVPVADWPTEFRKRWAVATAAEFTARYNVKPGEPIPPMAAFDEAESIFRARCGYATYGYPTISRLTPGPADAAILAISNATNETKGNVKETGYGLCDADVAAYLYRAGICGYGGAAEPWNYRGKTLADALASNFGGGVPSGG
jgi:hypothetical protein